MFSEVDRMQNSRFGGLFVAAIHIGSRYSGYGFSSRCDWQKVLSSQGIDQTKTCLLLKKDLSEFCFGREAEDKNKM